MQLAPLTFLLFFPLVLANCPATPPPRCNDGNNINGDGCSQNCTIEDGWKCPASETIGPCVCYCVLPQLECGCNWVSTGSGSPLPDIPSFERVGFGFQQYQQGEWAMQGISFARSGCSRSSYWTDKTGGPACSTLPTPATEGLTMKIAVIPSTTIDYDNSQISYVNWVGSPIPTISAFERLGWECPLGKVPTSLYFERAGCQNPENLVSYTWVDQKSTQDYPACLTNANNGNEGLSWVAQCRPDPALANGIWMWIDAGFASPIQVPSDLTRLGGLCPVGYAMVGAYFLRIGCNNNLQWRQMPQPSQVNPKCPTPNNSTQPEDGLLLRLKCVRYGPNVYECGAMADHNEVPCDELASCVSVLGGTRCRCLAGYTGTGRNGSCLPIDMCNEYPNLCPPSPGGNCTTTGPGTYSCNCNQGYLLENGTCHPNNLSSTPSNLGVFPGESICTFEGTGGFSGTILFQTQVDSKGDPVGTAVTVDIAGNVSSIYRWDIRSFLFDTNIPDASACWEAGPPYLEGSTAGMTARHGRLANKMFFIDSDIKTYGSTSIVGRSIVLEEKNGNPVACCAIHLTNASACPTHPYVVPTNSKAACVFSDGREVFFNQLTPVIGSEDGYDALGNNPIGSEIIVNPGIVAINTTFPDSGPLKFFTNYPNGPNIVGCGPTSIITPGRFDIVEPIDYVISAPRNFFSITVSAVVVARGNFIVTMEVVIENPDISFLAWRKVYNDDSTVVETPILLSIPLDHPRATATVRFNSTSFDNPQCWGLASFSVTLDPVVETTIVREISFTGNNDLDSWTQLTAEGKESLPLVGACGSEISLLGGYMELKDGDYLEFKPSNSFSYLRLNVQFHFCFLQNWRGQTVNVVMHRLDPFQNTLVENVTLWSYTYTENPQASSCFSGSQYTDYCMFVNQTNSFIKSADQVYISIHVDGTPLVDASWALSSWAAYYLPPQTTFDLFQDRFRNSVGTYWTVSNYGPEYFSQDFFILCDGSNYNASSSPNVFGDRVLHTLGDLSTISFSKSSPQPFTRAIVTFDAYFLGEWIENTVELEANNITVWSQTHHYLYNAINKTRCQAPYNTNYSKLMREVSVALNFPQPQQNLYLTWALFYLQPSCFFGIGYLRVQILPDDTQLLQTTYQPHDPSLTSWQLPEYPSMKGGWVGISGPLSLDGIHPITEPPQNCSLPPGAFNLQMQNLIAFDSTNTQALGLNSNPPTLPRTYDKAIVEYYLWWLGKWAPYPSETTIDPSSFLKHMGQDKTIQGSPARYAFLDKPRSAGFYPNLQCGGILAEVNYRAHLVMEAEGTGLAVNLTWGSSLMNGGGWAISQIKVTYPPEIAATEVWQFTGESESGLSFFNSSLLTQIKPDSSLLTEPNLIFATSCQNAQYVIYNYPGGKVEYTYLADEPFTQVRVFFRYWFFGPWEGERGTLRMISDTGEIVNVWRMDWWTQLDPGTGFFYYSLCQNYPFTTNDPNSRGNSTLADWFAAQWVEGTFTKPTTTVRLIWDGEMIQQKSAFGLSHIHVQIVPILSGSLIERTSFQYSGPAVEGWNASIGNIISPPTVLKCGDTNINYLLGGTRMGFSDTLTLVDSTNITYPFQIVFISFQFWFFPTWNLGDLGVVSIWETDNPYNLANASFQYPFDLNDPVFVNGTVNCSVDLPYSKDYSFKIVLPNVTESTSITVEFWIDNEPGRQTAQHFAISSFLLSVQNPYPDWVILTDCFGSVYTPSDGNEFNSYPNANYGLGYMSNKHGTFTSYRTFIDNTVQLWGPYNIIGKSVGLFQKGTSSMTCCQIEQQGPAFPEPQPLPPANAGCTWRNKDTEGWIALSTPSTSGIGVTVTIKAIFYNAEATGPHAYSINARGFTLSEILPPNPRCSQTATGDIYGTNPENDDHIGPSSASAGFDNLPCPGMPGSSRCRMGDLSSKYGSLPAGTGIQMKTFDAGQLSLSGPFSVVGRSFVVKGTQNTIPLGCCTIGMGPVGMDPDSTSSYYDSLTNFTVPDDSSPEIPFIIPDPAKYGQQTNTKAETYPYWEDGNISVLVIGILAAVLMTLAVALYIFRVGFRPAAAPATFEDSGYVAM